MHAKFKDCAASLEESDLKVCNGAVSHSNSGMSQQVLCLIYCQQACQLSFEPSYSIGLVMMITFRCLDQLQGSEDKTNAVAQASAQVSHAHI